MKKLFAILAVLFAVTFAARADFNPVVQADATFDATVISPLVWSTPNPTSLTLPNGIAGQHRTGITGKTVDFVLTGEPSKDVTLTTHFTPTTTPTPLAGADVTLDYSWSLTTNPQNLGTGGTLTQTFSVTGINADANAHGTFTWTISVDAVYTSL